MATVKLLSGILRHVLLLVVGVQGVLRSPVSNSIYPSVFAGARRLPTASLSSPINGLSLKASDVLSAEEAISQDQLARALSEAQVRFRIRFLQLGTHRTNKYRNSGSSLQSIFPIICRGVDSCLESSRIMGYQRTPTGMCTAVLMHTYCHAERTSHLRLRYL